MKKIKCEVCGSDDIVGNHKILICKSCGCKFFPDSEYELTYIQEADIPTIEEVLSHKGLNPVSVKKDSRGVITIIDEYSGKTYTADQYRMLFDKLTHKRSTIKYYIRKLGVFINSISKFDIEIESVLKWTLIALIPIFLILGIISIRNQASIGVILFQFFIVIASIIHLFISYLSVSAKLPVYRTTFIGFIIQIVLSHFIIFGYISALEFIWRLLIGIILKITVFCIICYITSAEL